MLGPRTASHRVQSWGPRPSPHVPQPHLLAALYADLDDGPDAAQVLSRRTTRLAEGITFTWRGGGKQRARHRPVWMGVLKAP